MKWRLWVLVIVVLFSLFVIQPHIFRQGVVVHDVVSTSPAGMAGLSADKDTYPVLRERIVEINDQQVTDLDSYFEIMQQNASSLSISTKKQPSLWWPFDVENTYIVENSEEIGLTVSFVPTTNIRFGLDIQGGSRIVLEPQERLDDETFATLADSVERRLNVYGLSDISVKEVSQSFLGEQQQLLIVELPGSSGDTIKELITREGKFEAKINNQTIFTGQQIDSISNDPTRGAGISGCGESGTQIICQYSFPVQLNLEAARSVADATENLSVIGSVVDGHLSSPLELYLDDVKTDELNIAASLKGRVQQAISISGSGEGINEQYARQNAFAAMHEMQTLLRSGNLPTKLDIVKEDNISPVLGKEFAQNALLVGLVSAFGVALLIFLRYRTLKVAIPIVLTGIAEIIILLACASISPLVSIDVAAIGSIIIMLGTGIDHQIIITDQILSKNKEHLSWKGRLKKALSIIFTSYATTVFAMIAILMFSGGLGMLNGFAITTIVGLSIGVFITRPAYAAIAERLLKH